ncbi:MAG: ATP-dependent DNA ligase [Methanobacteriaceae archaeon]
MKYIELVNVYEALSATTKRLEKTEILSNFLKELDDEILPKIALMILGSVFPSWSSEEQGVSEKLLIKAIASVIGVSAIDVENTIREEGDIGEAAEKLYSKRSQTTFFAKDLSVELVYNNLRKLATISGNKSQSRKISVLLELLSSAKAKEAKYICRTVIEELRIGVGEGVIRDGLSQAFDIDKAVTERAYMLTNDLAVVAKVAKEEGGEGLSKLSLEVGRPVKPMLSQLSENIENSIAEMGNAYCETKYDGIRVQIHRNGNKISIFTRRLENITHAVPEIVEYINDAVPEDSKFIAEGEIIVTRDGKPISFQYILQRVRRKYNIEKAMEDVPLKLYLFDLLYLEKPLIDEPLRVRRGELEGLIKTSPNHIELSELVKVNSETADIAQNLFNDSIAGGHEGIMIKNPESEYIPGIRGKKMLKYKAEPETLDLVVVGGTYGNGKRAHWIGSYLLAIRDDGDSGNNINNNNNNGTVNNNSNNNNINNRNNNNLKTLAYAATGLDDDTLERLSKLMEKYKITEKGTQITVEPKIFLEIAYSEIVKSPEYEAGYSLRFPVVKRIRDDIGLNDIDTLERLESMFKG